MSPPSRRASSTPKSRLPIRYPATTAAIAGRSTSASVGIGPPWVPLGCCSDAVRGTFHLIGVFGGSGFYEFLHDSRPAPVATPYGSPAQTPLIGTGGGGEAGAP